MKKIVLGLVIVAAVAIAGYFVIKSGNIKGLGIGEMGSSTNQIGGSGGTSVAGSSAGGGDVLNSAAAEFAAAPLTETYVDENYGFGLKYPSGLTQTEIPADESSDTPGDMILFDNGFGVGFQIIVTPFGEPDANITPDRIRQDIPDMVINNSQDVNLGTLGKGTTFLDGDPTSPDTNRQIWFAGNGYLYQITSLPVFDVAMQRILATWTFK